MSFLVFSVRRWGTKGTGIAIMMTFRKLSLGIVMTCCVVLLYFVNPTKSGIYPPCPFHALTGLYCPGCGSLRAMHDVLHGEIRAALGLNPLMVVFIPVLCLLLAFRRWRYYPWVSWCALAVLLAYGIVQKYSAVALLLPSTSSKLSYARREPCTSA